MYQSTTQKIVEYNGLLSASQIIPGLALYIPTAGPTKRGYIIKAGDTLYALARRYNTSVESIIIENPGINPYQLFVGQKIRIPSQYKMTIETLGFIVPYNIQASMAQLNKTKDGLSYVAIVAYSFLESGWAYRILEDSPIIARAKQLGIKPLLMIRNIVQEGFSAELAGVVLSNPLLRQRLVASIVQLMEQAGYEGVSIDFEFIPPPQRYDFVLFLSDLKRAIRNRLLHVNVHAKTEDIPTNRIIGAYDYEAIGNVADIVAVMTMDYGYPGGPPDPVAPLWWMEQVVQYSVSLINPRKLQIAFPLYGYEWKLPETITTSLSANAAQNRAISLGTIIQYDSIASAPHYRFYDGTNPHIVWFEDIRSFREKYRLVDEYSLLGVTFWQLAFDFPQNWVFLQREVIIRK